MCLVLFLFLFFLCNPYLDMDWIYKLKEDFEQCKHQECVKEAFGQVRTNNKIRLNWKKKLGKRGRKKSHQTLPKISVMKICHLKMLFNIRTKRKKV